MAEELLKKLAERPECADCKLWWCYWTSPFLGDRFKMTRYGESAGWGKRNGTNEWHYFKTRTCVSLCGGGGMFENQFYTFRHLNEKPPKGKRCKKCLKKLKR
jgi:hypothetical protein